MSSKTREALNQLLGLIDNKILVFNNELDPSEVSNAQYQIDKADEAFAEPLKNCEVGTPEEQAKRFKNYCDSKACKRNVCHSYGYEELFHHECFPIWAQMPYNKE